MPKTESQQRGRDAEGNQTDKSIASRHDLTRRNPRDGAATLAKPVRLTNAEPESAKLAHLVEVEVKTIHHPELHLRADSQESDGSSDPYFYDAETEVTISIDGNEIAAFVNFQGTSDMADRDYQSLLSYLEENLHAELQSTVVELYEEARDFIPRQDVREQLISRRKAEAERAARRRLPRAKRGGDFFALVEKADEAVRIVMQTQQLSKMRGLKTAVAKEMFPLSDNPLQEIRRHCEAAGIADFFDLLCYTGHTDLAFQFYNQRERGKN